MKICDSYRDPIDRAACYVISEKCVPCWVGYDAARTMAVARPQERDDWNKLAAVALGVGLLFVIFG